MVSDEVRQLSLTKTTKQSLISLAFNLGGILTGLIVVSSLGIFLREAWAIALFPAILSMRGVVGGLFCGRLSTSLHLGTIRASFFGENTKYFSMLLSSIIALTFGSSILLGIVSIPFGAAFWGIGLSDGVAIFAILVATMGLSLLAISPVTIAVAFSSFRRGLDPDIVVYPVISTIADILVTLCYVLILNLFFEVGVVGQLLVLVICVVFACATLLVFNTSRREAEFARTVKESLYTLLIISFIVNITGSLLSQISEIIKNKPEIYAVYPALINTMGNVGAIVGSTATTKLALGTITPSFESIKYHRNQIVGAWVASMTMYTVYALFSSLSQASIAFAATIRFVSLLLATNIFTAAFMVCISFDVAIITFKRRLDPDNFVIPIESSLADTITTVSLLIMLSLIGGV